MENDNTLNQEYTYGKCVACRTKFEWPQKRPLLRHAGCPKCGRALERTTHQLQWPIERVPPKYLPKK